MNDGMMAAVVSYGLAIAVSFGVAGLIKLLVFVIQGMGPQETEETI